VPTGRPRSSASTKPYDAEDFVSELRSMNVTCRTERQRPSPAIDGRTTRHGSYAVSPRIRKHIEQAFDWIKTSRGARVGRWRIVEMEVTATSSIVSKRGVSPSRQVR
jgi:hypothetical protein